MSPPHPQDGTSATTLRSDGGASGPDHRRRWLLVVPPAVALAAVLGLAATGPEVLALGPGGPVGLLAWIALAGLYLLSLAGTLALYDDASATSGEWRPSPWAYVLGGAATLAAVRVVARAGTLGDPLTVALYALGSFVIGLPAAALVGGPVYLAVRRVRLGRTGLWPQGPDAE